MSVVDKETQRLANLTADAVVAVMHLDNGDLLRGMRLADERWHAKE
jgi:hypothetical protein